MKIASVQVSLDLIAEWMVLPNSAKVIGFGPGASTDTVTILVECDDFPESKTVTPSNPFGNAASLLC